MSTTSTASGPTLPEVRLNLYKPSAPFAARVVRNDLCTAGRKAAGHVRHLEFDVTGSELVGACLPGQAIGVLPPGVDSNGKPHKIRLYSLCSPAGGEDGDPTRIATTVKRTIDEHWDTHKLFLGVASNYLCDLQVGDTVNLSGPAGKKFLLPTNPGDHDYIFFATGTGIAPFRGMLLNLLNAGVPGRITLVMGVPYRTDLLYDDLFSSLAAKHPNFTYLTAVSREIQADGGPPMYVHDRVITHRDRLAAQLESPKNLIYICGVAGMELSILQTLAKVVSGSAVEGYLQADAGMLADPKSWNRKTLHHEVRPTGRIMLEVYD